MTRQKGAHLLHYDATEKRVCSSFSHDAPITLIFGALILGKAGFLMKRPKQSVHLMHYYIFSRDLPKSLIFDR